MPREFAMAWSIEEGFVCFSYAIGPGKARQTDVATK
jgi:hypothetical protein